jgi:beta-galactosidase
MLKTRSFEVANGSSKKQPQLPAVPLAGNGFDLAAADTMPVVPKSMERRAAASSGRFAKDFQYSGPSRNVHLELDAQQGKKIYSDLEYQFANLPEALRGSDFVQATDADKQYNAVDLMELAVKKGSVVFLAHDDRLPRPDWLRRQFKATDMTLTINKRQMTVFEHGTTADESVTLGANADSSSAKSCNMYVVFVAASLPVSAELKETRGQ